MGISIITPEAINDMINELRAVHPLIDKGAVQIKGSSISVKISQLPQIKDVASKFIVLLLFQITQKAHVYITNFDEEVFFDENEIVFVIKEESKFKVDNESAEKRGLVAERIIYALF